MLKRKFKISFVILLALAIVSFLFLYHTYHAEQPAKAMITMTVQPKAITKTLYFSGVIMPLQQTAVLAPLNGVIIKQLFHFGEPVKKGQILFLLNSSEQISRYQSSLMSYLRAKQALARSERQWTEAQLLYKEELEPRNEYQQDHDAYLLDRITYLQAKNELEAALKYHTSIEIDKININDVQALSKILNLNQSNAIRIVAPADGVALFPQSDDGSNNAPNNSMDTKMGEVKEGDVLLDVGDMQGITIQIKINQMDINQIHINQKAVITCPAFPDLSLGGDVAIVSAQAMASEGTSLFIAKIIVPQLTSQQREVIHVGMNVQVAIALESKPQLLVPFSAIIDRNGARYIKIKDIKTGKIIEKQVNTGQTTEDSVVIESGLNPGDKIVISH